MEQSVYKHLLSTYGRQPGIWFALICELIRSLINRVYVVILLAGMVSAVSAGDYPRARQYVLIYVIVVVISIFIGSAGDLVGTRTENKQYGSLMTDYYQKLTSKDMSFYRNAHTGYLTAMFRQYLDGAILLVRMVRGDGIRTATSLIFPTIVLLVTSWKIGILAVLVIVSQLVYMFWSSSKAAQYRDQTNEIYRKISGEVADDLANIIAFKSAGKETVALERMKRLQHEETTAFMRRRQSAVFYDFPRNIATVFFVSAAFWVALSTNAPTTPDTVALLILTLTYMFQIVRNVSDLPDFIYRYDELISRIGPTLEILSKENEAILSDDNAPSLRPSAGEITLDKLDFKYSDTEKTRHIFKKFSLNIKGGEHVGIVGLSGAGKSTLASLLMRFDDVNAGKILIDGTDIRNVNPSSLRRCIAYVPQEPVLFHRSIGENIAYHNEAADEKSIVKAAKAAHAHEFITELPAGYDTIVGERGVKLSGGQKQRVVIARAILKNAPIILFDEATSALDSESEQIIQNALPKIIGNHTAIIIAHRLSTVANLDRIVVMHNGAIEEQGTHKQLLAKQGRYYSLWQKQTAGQIKP